MDDRGLSILRRLMSELEGAPWPVGPGGELYAIWYEHAQSVAQEALEYLNTVEPGHGREGGFPDEFS
jgi:hypothetical protein